MPPKENPAAGTRKSTMLRKLRKEQRDLEKKIVRQVFEKPTQMYRYLRARHESSPVFLHRTLTYMAHRMSRNHKNRRNFKVDSLLERVQAPSFRPPSQMTLTFAGFYDWSTKRDEVTVEAVILKVWNKNELPLTQPPFKSCVPVGSCEVPHNPEGTANASGALKTRTSVITVPGNSFCASETGLVRSHVLLLKVAARGETNDSELDEPPFKKALHDGCRRGPASGGGIASAGIRHYVGEMTVYKQQRCILTEGDYELVLRPWKPKAAPPARVASWESSENAEVVPLLEAFEKCPKVAFRLAWGTAESSSEVTANHTPKVRPVLSPLDLNVAEPWRKNMHNMCNRDIQACQQQQIQGNGQEVHKQPEKGGSQQEQQQQQSNGQEAPESSGTAESQQKEQQKKLAQPTRVAYQFVFQQKMLLRTKARNDLRCPWCLLQCCLLPALLKHLKCCHERFTFLYAPHPKGACIQVSINEYYNKSHAGDLQEELHLQVGYTFGQARPAWRTPVTDVMVCRPKRTPLSILEFVEQGGPDNETPYIPGHSRVYYHSTGTPIRPQQADYDSESETYPEWRSIHDKMMIDEFDDVNEGEKELMKMWNSHIIKHNVIGDCHVPRACNLFVEEQGKELIRSNLYNNFVLHMNNLFDYGLVSQSDIYYTVRKLQTFLPVKDTH